MVFLESHQYLYDNLVETNQYGAKSVYLIRYTYLVSVKHLVIFTISLGLHTHTHAHIIIIIFVFFKKTFSDKMSLKHESNSCSFVILSDDASFTSKWS